MKYKKLQHNYEGYLQEIFYDTQEADELHAHTLLQKFNGINRFNNQALPVFFIIDYTRQQYMLYSDTAHQVSGYHAREFLDGGLDMLRFVAYENDFKIFCNRIFSRNCDFLKSIPQHEHEKYLFSYTFRVRSGKGEQLCILQQGSYITSPLTGLPLYSLGICSNITFLKRDTRMVHVIEKKSPDNTFEGSVIEQNYFYPDEEDALFTLKEKEVLLYMADGLSAKQIAGKLHISETTVITHRKNMMDKANAKNAVELVANAIRNSII